jgi:hypothetical protein
MSKWKRRDSGPRIFTHDNSGSHFDPYYDRKEDARKAHERGVERKILYTMGERVKARTQAPDYEPQNASRRPVTLSTLKWGKTP